MKDRREGQGEGKWKGRHGKGREEPYRHFFPTSSPANISLNVTPFRQVVAEKHTVEVWNGADSADGQVKSHVSVCTVLVLNWSVHPSAHLKCNKM